MVVETRATPKMSIAAVAGDSKFGESAQRSGHAIGTRLVEDLRDVTSTCFVAPFTHVLSSHGTSKFCDHAIISFDIIVKYIKSFSGVYLTSDMTLAQFRPRHTNILCSRKCS